jgi:Tfp pilus assembly protein PilZ
MELRSGEYEILSEDEALVGDRQRMPDLAVLGYIDKVIGSGEWVASVPLGSGRRAKSKEPAQPPPIPPGPGGGQRRMPRAERSFVVTFGPSDSQRTSLGFLKDLSLGGLFVSADPPAPQGEELQLAIQIPTDEGMRSIQCQGRVVWNTLEDNDKLEVYGPGFGVEFTVLSAESSELLRSVVAGEL